MSVQWIACPDCAFKLPYAILGKQGSFRTGREFASLCRHYAELPAGSKGSGSPTTATTRAPPEPATAPSVRK